ncbi:hypothetical protein MPDQ_006656 [Monascus purpureus]|uniref:Uncharacterized protein n=1 Tax=Monascus purpureus TaxID=5098 RepID=A0A507R5W1_MONPU|nr:hypothetical protein MPDQ_006656 [Monascus purpureus]BDD60613.1 hypothetical protein MAP00_005725 [Monascus purpureus]
MNNAAFVYLLIHFVSFVCATSTSLPYTPSYIFASPQHNNSLVYLLLSDSLTENKTVFLSLDVSGHFNATNTQYSVLLEKTPFSTTGHGEAAIVPVMDGQGVIKVYAGDCQTTPSEGSVWQFVSDNNSSIGNGTWDELSVALAQNGSLNDNLESSKYMAAGFAYASTDTNFSSIYTFGGMCPFSTGSDYEDSMIYSQSMVLVEPIGSSANITYEAQLTAERAPPSPQAGFTITPLLGTSVATSAGGVLQQQNFLLIGGHDHDDFIDMFQLALFSLPQGSWSFVDVGWNPDSGTPGNAAQKNAVVQPRSGHTAVLSPDGTKVVIFGGWIGDTGTAAEPQLAILDVGKGYGGSGQWAWNVPPLNGSGLPGVAGIFGHGATMLPGGVMMIAGGYTIPPPTSSKRPTSQPQLNSQVFLYNITSNTWTTSYANPSQQTSKVSKDSPGQLSSASKAGLGVGIGVGVPAVAAIAVFAWFNIWKRRAHRTRDSVIRDLALGAERSHFWDDPNMSSSFCIRGQSAWNPARDSLYPWAGNQGNEGDLSWRDHGEATAENTGLLRPTADSRQTVNVKPHRQYSGSRTREVPDGIHTIDERDEDETNVRESLITEPQQTGQQNGGLHDTSGLLLEPQAVADLENPRDHSGAGSQNGDGSHFPVKSDRTTSDLSESSTTSFSERSTFSAHNFRVEDFKRHPDFSRGMLSTKEQLTPPSTSGSNTSNGMSSAEKYRSADIFSTARTTFLLRQAERESLLGTAHDSPTSPESPSKNKPDATKQKAYGLIGSVRRAINDSLRKTPSWRSPSAAPVMSSIDRSPTVFISSSSYGSTLPRRAVSASAELYRRKQGAKDWDATNNNESKNTNRRQHNILASHTLIPRSIPGESILDGLYSLASDDDGEDWDVEAAAEGRRVQVTFTVPKEKLRVVNATARDMDDFSEKSPSRRTSAGAQSISR